MSHHRLVSVVIPCYNQENFIEAAIDSVLNQTYPCIEIICIDDFSADSSLERINKYLELPNFKLIRNSSNLGVCVSRNLAVDAAAGEYILPLDGDDTIEPSYVEEAVEVISTRNNVGMVYSKARYIGGVNKYWDLPEYCFDEFIFNNCIFCSALFRKSDFLKAGGYKTYMKNGLEDYELWICFIESGLEPYRIDKILFNYRRKHKTSRTDEMLSAPDSYVNMKKEIILHHLDLYLSNDCFMKFITEYSPQYIDKIEKKCSSAELRVKKYKNLLKLTCILLFSIMLLVIMYVLR